ncbi:MAG TPA: TonB-dependent receptor [Casimicrobiaceae bacterium]|nr:TonB-dependent receptor [Casimicrobiaceae bacterium]
MEVVHLVAYPASAMMNGLHRFGTTVLLATIVASRAFAQEPPATVVFDPIVVTATRHAARAFDVPASIDIIEGDVIRDGQPAINLSETLVRVPGVFAANRQNYAQDLQISSRGFGARAAFGVRGVRLYQDGIPVTMPDGQGQTGSFNLLSTQRIEVLRGPFSTLYGNASGGVIAVFSEEGVMPAIATVSGGAGSYDQWTAGSRLRGAIGNLRYVVAGSEFQTDGFREHSSARRDLVNVKLSYAPSQATRIVVIASSQYQPETQDPLGLTRAQWEADPRQADAAASLFDTRKTIQQLQGGAAVEHRVGDATLAATGYAGRRRVRQYLGFSGVGATSSGGVVDLDRDFGGVGARITWRTAIASQPLTLTAGADFDRMRERRRGFVNQNGALGELRRDEDDIVRSQDAYAQAEWRPLPPFALTLGLRSSVVRYESNDDYVNAVNPDDSGSRRFGNTSPVVGAVYSVLPDVNLYASYGRGFETPTFAELAYNRTGPGLNFALDAARSRAYEVGAKARIGRAHRLNVALYRIDTHDEIVTDVAVGGRTTFRNASRTRREGAELVWDGALPMALHAHVALSWIRAEFTDAFATGTPPQPVQAGNRLPGVPATQAYGELAWRPADASGFNAAAEVQHVAKLHVNDRNSDAAPAYTIANVRFGIERQVGRSKLAAFLRVNNVFDRQYVGSVIVGDANGRFFEPAPGRNVFVGATVDILL